MVAFKSANKTDTKNSVELGKSIRVKIRLDHPLNSESEAEEILDRVFFQETEACDYSRPTYLRPDQRIPPEETIYAVKKDNNVHPPVPKFAPDPDYTEEARKHRYQGTVILRIVVDKAGTVSRIIIETAAGMGLDATAAAKVSTWRFEPATLEGRPVAVEVSVETQFHLY
jgi:TonB family protein